MRVYNYRPPQITRSELIRKPPKSALAPYALVFGVLLVAAGTGLASLRPIPLVRAVVTDVGSTPAFFGEKAVPASTTNALLTHVVPFLKTSPSDWKLQSGRPRPAIGGGPGLLKDALDVKASISANYETGEVYYAAGSSQRLPMASVTKIMTAMVALDLASPDELFSVEDPATQVEPTIIGIKSGEKLSTIELIKGGLLTSGNDAIAALAEGVGRKYDGNTELFVQAMNKKAAYLGLKNTHFANPQGYDSPDHYSTCEDLVAMTHYALSHYPQIAHIVTEKEDQLVDTSTHHSINLPNWNMLINTYPGADGVKIGNTGDAGHTTIASATRNGNRVISVVLGAEGILKRDMAAAELLNVGFSDLGIAPFQMTEDILRTRIKDWYP